MLTRTDKGCAVKRARPSKKVRCSGLGLCLEMSLVFDFGQGRPAFITSMTLPLNYIFVLLLANVDVIPKQKQLSTV